MQRLSLILVAALGAISLAGCEPGIDIPAGEPVAGRRAVETMRCYTCHVFAGEDFPAPTADPPVKVVLGDPSTKHSRNELANAILRPSEHFTVVMPEASETGPSPASLEQIRDGIAPRSGELSRMANFTEAMTIRQFIDIVTYLEHLERRAGIP